jgi:hypothetical protein
MRPLAPIALTLVIAAALAACGSSESESEMSSATSPPHRSGQGPKVLAAPDTGSVSEPTRLEFTGLEGRPYAVSDISWDSWGDDTASGEGTVQRPICDPDCGGEVYEDGPPADVELRLPDSKCGALLYRQLIVSRPGDVGQYFPIACPGQTGYD